MNSFHNNMNKQFHMFVSVRLEVKLVRRIMPKFEFNLKVLNTSSFHLISPNRLSPFRLQKLNTS